MPLIWWSVRLVFWILTCKLYSSAGIFVLVNFSAAEKTPKFNPIPLLWYYLWHLNICHSRLKVGSYAVAFSCFCTSVFNLLFLVHCTIFFRSWQVKLPSKNEVLLKFYEKNKNNQNDFENKRHQGLNIRDLLKVAICFCLLTPSVRTVVGWKKLHRQVSSNLSVNPRIHSIKEDPVYFLWGFMQKLPPEVFW